MSGYVIAGYAVTIGGLGAYTLMTLRRLRRLRQTAAGLAAGGAGDEAAPGRFPGDDSARIRP